MLLLVGVEQITTVRQEEFQQASRLLRVKSPKFPHFFVSVLASISFRSEIT